MIGSMRQLHKVFCATFFTLWLSTKSLNHVGTHVVKSTPMLW